MRKKELNVNNKLVSNLKLMDKGIFFMLVSSMFGSLSGAVAKVLSDTMVTKKGDVLFSITASPKGIFAIV